MKTKKSSLRSKFFTENLLVFLEADPPKPELADTPLEPEELIPIKTVEEWEREVNRLIEEKRLAEIRIDDGALLYILEITIDPDILNYAAGSINPRVRMFVAENPATSEEILRKLSDDADEDVLYSVAIHPKTSVDVLRKLAAKLWESERMKVSLINNPSTPLDIWQKLANDPDDWTRKLVAGSKYAPESVLSKLASDVYLTVRQHVAENPNTPFEALDYLSRFDEEMKDFVLRNPKLLKGIEGVRWNGTKGRSGKRSELNYAAIAGNPMAPPEILEDLAKDESLLVRMKIAGNPNTPPAVLVELLKKYPDDVIIAASCAGNKNIPSDVLRDFSRHKSSGVRLALALNPNVPDDVLWHILAEDPEVPVRAAAAEHPRMLLGILIGLSKDKDSSVRYSVAKNPRASFEILRALADDPDEGVRDRARKMLRKRK